MRRPARGGCADPSAGRNRTGTTRTIRVTALDTNGVPVRAMTPADFIVKDGGKERQIVSLEPASEPIQVILIVDDNGSDITLRAPTRVPAR